MRAPKGGSLAFKDHHHLVPRSRGGHIDDPRNLIVLWRLKHVSLHRLYGNRTLSEIITFLTTCSHRYRNQIVGSPAWKHLFKEKTVSEALSLLKRVQRIKPGVYEQQQSTSVRNTQNRQKVRQYV